MRGVPSPAERAVASTVMGSASTPTTMPVPIATVDGCTNDKCHARAGGYAEIRPVPRLPTDSLRVRGAGRAGAEGLPAGGDRSGEAATARAQSKHSVGSSVGLGQRLQETQQRADAGARAGVEADCGGAA